MRQFRDEKKLSKNLCKPSEQINAPVCKCYNKSSRSSLRVLKLELSKRRACVRSYSNSIDFLIALTAVLCDIASWRIEQLDSLASSTRLAYFFLLIFLCYFLKCLRSIFFAGHCFGRYRYRRRWLRASQMIWWNLSWRSMAQAWRRSTSQGTVYERLVDMLVVQLLGKTRSVWERSDWH